MSLLVATACGRTGLQGPAQGGADERGETGSDGPGHSESSATSSSESSSTGDTLCDPITGLCPLELRLRRAVDILFVVDNSGSMGGEQGTLVQSFRSFVEVLESQQVGANYRIGVTTTAADGQLRATSCRERLFDFVFEWTFGTIDERQRGCLDHCIYESIPLPVPWVEKSEGTTNLPAGYDMAAALQCIGPPGINGPGYEAPLESMKLVLEDDGGFLRPDALLAVIFLTDEADCSASPEQQGWLQFEGYPFWTTPDRATSGACWNAGVTCVGGPGVYDDCFAQDKARDGGPSGPEDAVLYPRERYIDALRALSLQRQAQGYHGQVLLSLIAGVPLDYPQTHTIEFRDSDLPDFNIEYGIGPACNFGSETVQDPPGIPDVRMREVVEAFATDQPNVFSVCSADYGVALESIAGAIGEINEKACVGGCVLDLEPGGALQPSCTLTEQFPPETGEPDRVVEPCVVTGDGWDFPGPGIGACYRVLDDTSGMTPGTVDDMDAYCVTSGFNLELVVERRPEVPVPSGTSIAVHCDLVAEPGIACPP
ncbi:MAG: VWA domain-containing protein [Nannocystaceae bacterium]|nr:VWA domain-containing protein [Nannocystaceae bacterium]